MATIRAGKNGGKIKVMEKGDPPNVGAGRPKGARSFKKLLRDALNKKTKAKTGEMLTIKEASVLKLVSMYFSDETDDNAKIRIFALIRDTIGETPIVKKEITGADGKDLIPDKGFYPTDLKITVL